ncbi:MAG: molybdopterin molybdotransferase MoeA [Symbiobacteriaceae bacterium]|nr:molybdopterin molybdotransferase MoeA [Symbiobacteriaceae bacterium]
MLTLITVPEALQELNSRWRPQEKTVTLELGAALGMALAEPVRSPRHIPPFARATMDGYAVQAADTYGASETASQMITLCGQIAMGEAPQHILQPGETMQIATGGMLPTGADAVVMLEYTELLGDQLLIQRPVAPGENTTQPGEDLRQDQEVLTVGHILTAADIGLCASLGYCQLDCFTRPRVAIFSTGDELLSPGEEYQPGMIYDSNGSMLHALCQSIGVTADFLACLPDELHELQAALAASLQIYDLVIFSGGTSVGGKDFTKVAIDACGSPGVLVHGLNIKPGKPTLLGLVAQIPVFGLSGNPVTAALTFQLLVEPTLGRWQSVSTPTRSRLKARLTRNLPSPGGMISYIRCRISQAENIPGLWLAHPLLGGSGLLSTLAQADALLTIPANAEGLRENSEVEVELLR